MNPKTDPPTVVSSGVENNIERTKNKDTKSEPTTSNGGRG